MTEADFKDRIEPFLKRLPAVTRPKGHVHFKTKLMWTIGILALYFILANVTIFGLSSESIDIFYQYRAFFAGKSGTLMMLGIGPIVTASIVLQLLVGAQVVNLDLGDPRDQAIYQGVQKLLVFVMIVLETVPQMLGGFLLPDAGLAAQLGVSIETISAIMFIQICIGGVLVLLMDEVVSKWGIGSGVSLFIVAGVAQALVTSVFNWGADARGIPIGLIPKWGWIVSNMNAVQMDARFMLIEGGILALVTTIVIFFIVVYAESMRVEIPLAHSRVRGARGRFPIKLIYASVLPMILVRALQANIQMIGMVLARRGSTMFGTYAVTPSGSYVATSGLMYYLNPINSPYDWVPGLVRAQTTYAHLLDWQITLRLLTDITLMVVGGAIFAIFWVQTASMGPKDVAKQINRSGMQIPGFRRDVKILERIMQRYIPKITIIGGVFVGLLAVFANMMGTLGNASGTGLLLTVSIVYKFYEQLANEQVMEMYPMMRSFLGVET